MKRYQTARVKDPTLRLCPCCRTMNETADHVFQCNQNPKRQATLLDFRKSMSPTQPDPTFALLKEGILQWLLGTEHTAEIYLEFPVNNHELMEEAMREQTQIGWKAATRGFFSKKWILLAELSSHEGATQQEGKGAQTMQKISKAIHAMSRALWLARNEALHGDQSHELQIIRNSDIAEMRNFHSNPDLLPAGDRHYCEGSFEQLLRKSPSSRRRWLRYMRMVQARTTQEGTRQLTITEFFQRVEAQTPA